MANADREVKVIVGGDSSGAETALKNTHNSLNQMEGGFRGIQGTLSSFRSAIAGLGLTMLAKELLDAGMAAERFRNSFAAATGTMSMGQQEFAFARAEANRLGLDLQTTADSFLKLSAAAKGTALEGEPARKIFSAVAEASRALGLSSEESKGALLAISQMISKGTVQAEELRGQLGERLPGAFQIAARAMGVTTAELGKMLEQGKVLAEDFLPKFSAQLLKDFPASAESMSGLTAEVNRLKTSFFELKTTIMASGGETIFSAMIRDTRSLFEEFDIGIKKIDKNTGFWNKLDALLNLTRRRGIGQFLPGEEKLPWEAPDSTRDPFSYTPDELKKLRQQFLEREGYRAPPKQKGKPDKILMGLQKDQITSFLKYAPSEAEIFALGYEYNKFAQIASPLAGPGLLGSGSAFKGMTGLGSPKFSLGDYSIKEGYGYDMSPMQQEQFDLAAYRAKWEAEQARMNKSAIKAEQDFFAMRAELAGSNTEIELLRIQREEDQWIQSWAMQTSSFEEFERRKIAIAEVSAQRRKQLEYETTSKTLGDIGQYTSRASQMFDTLYQVTGRKNKEMFYIGKGIAIANTIINTAEAMMKAYAQTGIFGGPAAAAMIGAVGAAQVALIASQTPESSGSFPSGNYGAGTPGSPVVTQPTASQAGSTLNLTIKIEGNVISDDRWVEDKLAPTIRQLVGRDVNFGLQPSNA